MPSLQIAYESAVGRFGIDFVRIESEARARGITDTESLEYLEFATDRFVPMLDALEASFHEQFADVYVGTAARMTESDVRAAVREMDGALEQASGALDAALAEGKRMLGLADAPNVTASSMARYVLSLNVLAFHGRLRHVQRIPADAVRGGAMTVAEALEDANNVALTYQALIEMRRSGTLDVFVGARPPGGVGAAPAAGFALPVWAGITIAIAVVLVVFLLSAAAVAAHSLALIADLLEKYCFDEEGGVRTHEGQPLCKGLPDLMPQIVGAFVKPGMKLAEQLGWAAVVAAGLWAGAKFVLPAIAKEAERREAAAV